jgi:hypothetical protein
VAQPRQLVPVHLLSTTKLKRHSEVQSLGPCAGARWGEHMNVCDLLVPARAPKEEEGDYSSRKPGLWVERSREKNGAAKVFPHSVDTQWILWLPSLVTLHYSTQ